MELLIAMSDDKWDTSATVFLFVGLQIFNPKHWTGWDKNTPNHNFTPF
jgi:hypothetical protein